MLFDPFLGQVLPKRSVDHAMKRHPVVCAAVDDPALDIRVHEHVDAVGDRIRPPPAFVDLPFPHCTPLKIEMGAVYTITTKASNKAILQQIVRVERLTCTTRIRSSGSVGRT